MRGNRRGFTFIELMTVLLVLAILCALAVTRYTDLKSRALSATVTADLDAVRLAAYNTMYSIGDWPPEQPAGAIPPEMQSHLRQGFSFSRPEYTLDWENLGGGGGGMQVGVTVTSTDAKLMRVLSQTIGNKGPFIVVGNQITLVIVGPDGQG
jgi:prepilin-type N-terminal cleavage/methylation domain-containing protein